MTCLWFDFCSLWSLIPCPVPLLTISMERVETELWPADGKHGKVVVSALGVLPLFLWSAFRHKYRCGYYWAGTFSTVIATWQSQYSSLQAKYHVYCTNASSGYELCGYSKDGVPHILVQWNLGHPRDWNPVLNSEVVLSPRSSTIYWLPVALGAEGLVFKSQVVPIFLLVSKQGISL